MRLRKQNGGFVSFYDYEPTNSLRYKLMNEDVKYNYKFTSYKNKMIYLYEQYIKRYFISTSIFNPYDDYIDNLNEGLIISYNYDIFAEFLEKYTGITVLDINYVDNNLYTKTKMLYFITYEHEYNKCQEKVETYINKCGYFISQINKYTFQNHKLIDIQVEPKYIVEVTSCIYDKYDLIYDKNNKGIKNKCNGILYHITLDVKYNKIKDNGLIPKSGNKKSMHPERIYFFPSNFIDKDNSLIRQAENLYKQDNQYIETVQKYVTEKGLKIDILKIDLYKYQNIKYRFFQDPNHPQGIFTYEPVHPKCVELYKSFYI